MEIIKPQIQLTLNKTEMNQLIVEGLADVDTAAAIKRALTPLLAKSFPQFPEFTNITLGETDESGATEVILKQPRESKPATKVDPEPTPDELAEQEPVGAIKSIEPAVIDEESSEPVDEPAPVAAEDIY